MNSVLEKHRSPHPQIQTPQPKPRTQLRFRIKSSRTPSVY